MIRRCFTGKKIAQAKVEKVKSRSLYHVSVTKAYKQAFGQGQEITVGETDNPFFSFYEAAREYPVNNNGTRIDVRAVAFLRQIRDGLITPGPGLLPTVALEVTQHYVMLCRELIMEEIRLHEFGGKPPSRQRCLYACDTLAEAKHWQSRLGDPSSMICELSCSGTILKADAALLLGDSEPLSVTRDRARQYWRGEAAQNPEWETLFVGRATITRTGL